MDWGEDGECCLGAFGVWGDGDFWRDLLLKEEGRGGFLAGFAFKREGSGRGRGLFRGVQEKLGDGWLRGFCVVGYGNRMVLRECRGVRN